MSNTHKTICALSSAQGSKPAPEMSRVPGLSRGQQWAWRKEDLVSQLFWGGGVFGFPGHCDFGDTQVMCLTSSCGQVESGRKRSRKAAWCLGN